MREKKASPIVGLAIFGLLQGLSGETTLDLSAAAALFEAKLYPSLAWGMTTSAQRLGDSEPSLYFDLDADASKNLNDSGYSGSADLEVSAYRLIGSANIGLKLEAIGALPSSAAEGSAVAALSLPVTLNGESLSFSIGPKVAIDPTDSGYESFGMESAFSLMTGDLVVKPGFGFAAIHAWNGGTVYALKPGVDISWYPGFPLSIALTGEYRADIDSATENSWGIECIGVASPVATILLTLTANGNFSASSSSVAATLESAFSLRRIDSGGEWSLPLKIGFNATDGQPSYSLGLGLRYAF